MNSYSRDEKLRLIVGRSGSGKNYLIDVFGLVNVASYTTRPMRKDDIDGINHTFVTDKEYFETKKEDMAAYTLYHGYHYWTTFELLSTCSAYDIDPPGVECIIANRYKLPNGFVTILLVVPLWKRIHNMRNRKTPWKLIISRIINDRKVFKDFEKSGNYDYLIKM